MPEATTSRLSSLQSVSYMSLRTEFDEIRMEAPSVDQGLVPGNAEGEEQATQVAYNHWYKIRS